MDNEIDLLELFLKLFILIRKNIKTIFLAIFIGAMIGSFTFFVYPNYLSYKITGYSPYIEKEVICNCINEMSLELKSKNLDEFCKSNNFDKTDFDKIKSIHVNILKDNSESNLEISILTKMPLNIQNVSNDIENYISMNPYIRKKIAYHESQLKNTINFINEQIDNPKNKDTVNYKELKITLQEESATSLYLKKNDCEKELAFLKPILITNTSPIPTDKKHGLILFILGGSFIAVFLIIIFFFFKKLNKLTAKTPRINSETTLYKKSA